MTLDSIKQSIKQEPYFECEDGLLYCADCMDILPQLPDKCIPLCLTDPPYGIGEDGSRNHTRGCLTRSRFYPKTGWDDSVPPREYFQNILRVSAKQIIWGGNYFLDYLNKTSCFLVWDKDNGATDFADCELAWTNLPCAVRKFKWKWQGMLQENMGNKETRVHPTQKPIPLMLWCLGFAGGLVLDTHLGSGTTAVACKRLGRKFIGIEISETYAAIARDRIMAESKGLTVKELKQGQKVLF